MKGISKILFILFIIGFVSSCSGQKTYNESSKKKTTTTKSKSVATKEKKVNAKAKTTPKKTVATKNKKVTAKKTKVAPKKEEVKNTNLLPTTSYKTNVIATYYHDKFNGRKTANGTIFDNNKQTAAHRTLPFGTKLKVINRLNGKWIYVTVNDRGPVKTTREIDLTKRAFMDITDNKNKGELVVDIEIVE
ncbi:MAG: septal ring lytic transglycosylase RlpA family protein [Capnocytophaga sp.]|nr:septal ring lytic transglycosylase RlpA family protein [Capnocytophaga sp.]